MRAIVAALAILAASSATAQQQSPQGEPALRPVRLMTVEPPRTEIARSFFGRVVARETVDLAFQVGGQLQRFPVSNGDRVTEGALLAQLDLSKFRRAVERAELNLAQAERASERTRRLAQQNIGAEVAAEDAFTARELAAVELAEARENLEDATLNAAFDGLIAQRLVANYSTVDAGTPVLRLHDMSEVRVEVDIPERLLRFAPDIEAIEFFADLGGELTGIPLEMAEYAAETEGASQSYRVDLAMPEVDGYTAIPGRSATVTAYLAQSGGDTLDVPVTALLTTPDRRNQVMVFEPTGADLGTVRPVLVTVVSREGASLAVRMDEDLRPGMEIVSSGAHLLTPGQDVRRFAGFSEAG